MINGSLTLSEVLIPGDINHVRLSLPVWLMTAETPGIQ